MAFRELINEMMSYINQFTNQEYSDWYVGITSNPRKRLFQDHNVAENGGAWIYSPADSSEIARSVENYIINNYKTDGDIGGGEENAIYVYSFLKTMYTRR